MRRCYNLLRYAIALGGGFVGIIIILAFVILGDFDGGNDVLDNQLNTIVDDKTPTITLTIDEQTPVISIPTPTNFPSSRSGTPLPESLMIIQPNNIFNLQEIARWQIVESPNSVAYSPDGTLLAIATSSVASSDIRLLNVSDGEVLSTLSGLRNTSNSVAFSPNGEVIAGGGDYGTLILWRVSDGELIHNLEGHHTGVSGLVSSVAFSPNGEIIASGSWDDTVRLWQVNDGELVNTLEGHTSSVYDVVFSIDGDVIISAGSDAIRIWRVSDGELLDTLTNSNPTHNSESLAVSPDGE